MRSFRIIILLGLISAYCIPAVIAQDTESEYEDYSYLWEDSKEQQKEAKRKAKEEKKRQKELEKLRKKGLLPDTLVNQDTVKLPTDSLQSPSDSLQSPSDSIPQEPITNYQVPQDTVKNRTDSTTTEAPEDPIIEEEPEEELEPEEEEPKEKRNLSGPPVEDFRAGMSSGGSSSFNGGLTVTQIEDQWYAGMTLNPELNLGKVGVGLNIPILYGLDDKSFRTEIFEDGVGIARLITYIRLGVQKTDPIYFKVGQLDNTMIGFGGLVNNYTNSTSFEKRKVGIHYDFNVKGLVGVDGLYSDFNFTSLNLLAVRPYIRPMAWSSIPIVKTFEAGATFMKDRDQTKLVTSDSTYSTYGLTEEGIGAFGLDAGVTLLSVPFIQIDLFATYSKLKVQSDSLDQVVAASPSIPTLEDGFKDGSGFSTGLNFRFHFIADVMALDARIERLNYTEHYLPQFFDATYEINKDAKILSLLSAEKMSGTYGSLTGHILKKVELGGSLMIPDNISDETPATVRVHADLERLADKFSFHGSYIKGNLTDLGDAFTFDERSLAKLRFIYHMNKFLAVGMDYYWAFVPTSDGGYKPQKYVSPYFGLSIAF